VSRGIRIDTPYLIRVDLTQGELSTDGGPPSPLTEEVRLPGQRSRGTLRFASGWLVVDRSRSTQGDLFLRYHAGTVEISDSLSLLCPQPTADDVAALTLLSSCLGLRPGPDRTHLRDIRRLPCLSVARIAADGSSVVRQDLSILTADGRKRGSSRTVGVDELLRRLLADIPSPTLVAASGGLASRALRTLLGADALVGSAQLTGPVSIRIPEPTGVVPQPIPVYFDQLRTTRVWPPLGNRHLGTAAILSVSSLTGANAVVAGHHLRLLLGTGPEECQGVAGPLTRLTSERLGTRTEWRLPWRRREHNHDHGSSPAERGQLPPWLSDDGRREIHTLNLANRAAWADWFRDVPPRTARVLWALTDPALAWLWDLSHEMAVPLHLPGGTPEALSALLHLPVRARGQVVGGRFLDAPILRRLAPDALYYADGAHRHRIAAATWVTQAAQTIREVAHDGSFARLGLIKPAEVTRILDNPFLRVEYAPALRQMTEADQWLTNLGGRR